MRYLAGAFLLGFGVCAAAVEGLPDMVCSPAQTGGFHDYPGGGESYEAVLFHPRTFTLETNIVFMTNLAESQGSVDLYLTLETKIPDEKGKERLEVTELECRRVRGPDNGYGYSCVNLPPSEMLLINAHSLRFTHAALGGWAFVAAADTDKGDSIFMEYGQCIVNEAPDR